MDAELSIEDKEFLAKCEEELKDRFTEKDEEYMKVFNRSPSIPPIMENFWQASNNSGRRNDRRNNRRFHPYDRRDRQGDHQYDRRDRQGDRPYDRRDRQGGGDRGYNDYNNYNRSRY
ncbi:RNA guanine-N7 methyltransferase activating subunit [Maniola jurtina]|uniref:RNA guanine-N7 methyltransferase activating subunit n=1 Tax=Maniola jurtina TaxID=191418 RepID=UPI001E688545|nr:RNA guanine-N7 methyltransferase activating subunit [Maniola jurtina]